MSANTNTGRPVGVSGGVQVQTAADAAGEAGKLPERRPDPSDALLTYLQQTINEANLPEHHKMMAKAKASELVFWIQAGLKAP